MASTINDLLKKAYPFIPDLLGNAAYDFRVKGSTLHRKGYSSCYSATGSTPVTLKFSDLKSLAFCETCLRKYNIDTIGLNYKLVNAINQVLEDSKKVAKITDDKPFVILRRQEQLVKSLKSLELCIEEQENSVALTSLTVEEIKKLDELIEKTKNLLKTSEVHSLSDSKREEIYLELKKKLYQGAPKNFEYFPFDDSPTLIGFTKSEKENAFDAKTSILVDGSILRNDTLVVVVLPRFAADYIIVNVKHVYPETVNVSGVEKDVLETAAKLWDRTPGNHLYSLKASLETALSL